MELVAKETFKFLGIREFSSKQGNKLHVAQFHDGNDVYEFFLEQEQLKMLPAQYSDVELTFELRKFRNNPSIRLKNITPATKRLGVVNG